MTRAIPYAQAIEHSLERVGALCADPTPLVYARLFAEHPAMQAHFWRDTNGAIRGEMLSRAFDAILDFVGPRRYAHHMIGAEMVTHEGYEIPREVFASFFGVIADTVRDILGQGWTAEVEAAWGQLRADIDHYVGLTPRSDVSNPFFEQQRQAFERPFLKG